MVKSKNKSKVLDDLVQTRLLLTQKLKSMKSNEMDRINMLENTFKPITKPLNEIAENFLKKNKKADKYNVENPTSPNNNNNKRELIKSRSSSRRTTTAAAAAAAATTC